MSWVYMIVFLFHVFSKEKRLATALRKLKWCCNPLWSFPRNNGQLNTRLQATQFRMELRLDLSSNFSEWKTLKRKTTVSQICIKQQTGVCHNKNQKEDYLFHLLEWAFKLQLTITRLQSSSFNCSQHTAIKQLWCLKLK